MKVLLVVVLVAGLAAVIVLFLGECLLRRRHRLRPHGEITDAYELAVLVQGRRSLAATVVTGLVRRNAIRESSSRTCTLVAGMSADHPAERVALDYLSRRAGRAQRYEIEQAPDWAPLHKQIRAELVRRELLRPAWMGWAESISMLLGFGVWFANISTFTLVINVLLDVPSVLTTLGEWWPALLAPPLTAAFALYLNWAKRTHGGTTLVGDAVYRGVLAAHPGHDDSLEAYVLHGERPPEREPAPAPAQASAAGQTARADDDDSGCGTGEGCGCGDGDA